MKIVRNLQWLINTFSEDFIFRELRKARRFRICVQNNDTQVCYVLYCREANGIVFHETLKIFLIKSLLWVQILFAFSEMPV